MFPKTGRYGVSAIEDRAMSRRSSLTIDSETHNTLVAAREAAKKAKDHELSLRIRAIILLGVLGKKKTEVAEICEIGLTTVYLWQRKYKSGGIEALRDNYKPKKCSLSEEAQTLYRRSSWRALKPQAWTQELGPPLSLGKSLKTVSAPSTPFQQ
jgi:hypothetical protein